MTDVVAADATLLGAFDCALGRLDTQTRAWVVGIGLLGTPGQRPSVGVQRVLDAAQARGTFPSGPFAVAPGVAHVEVSDDGRIADAHTDLGRDRPFQGHAFVGDGVVAVALTRSGMLDDGSSEPSHVMLSDVESVFVDAVELVEAYAAELGHRDDATVLVGIGCDVPGRPLELRVYDELGGDNLRPAAGYTRFDPIRVTYHSPLSDDELETLRWDTAVRIAHAFGVFLPQMVGQARTTEISFWPGPHVA